MQTFVENYLSKLRETTNIISQEAVVAILGTIFDAYRNNKRIFIFGNGGSAATSSHLMNDLNKLCNIKGKKRIKAIALTDNIPLMTAWGNDDSYNSIFVEQLKNLFEPGDICIAISGSGNSENVVQAVQYANENKGITIGLLGFDGGKIKDIVKHKIIINNNHYGIIEDTHHVLCHILSNGLKEMIEKR